MRVVDTSAWIEWLVGSKVGGRVQRELPDNDRWIVPTIVQYELARWTSRELPEEAAAIVMAFSGRLVVQPLDSLLATTAADLAQRHRLSVADAIIYATGVQLGADLLTCDTHFANLPNVVYFKKSAA